MSLVAIILVLGLIVTGVMMVSPPPKPLPVALLKAQGGTRFATLELLPDNKYVLKMTQDGATAATDDGTAHVNGRLGEDGTEILLTAGDGASRAMIFEKGTAWCHTESETCPPPRSIKNMNFHRVA